MMQLAAYVGKKYQYPLKPSTLFLKSGNYPKLGRELMLLSMLPKYQATAAAAKDGRCLSGKFPDYGGEQQKLVCGCKRR